MSYPIRIYVNGIEWPNVHTPFIKVPVEDSTDITTIDGTLYTNFTDKKRAWKLHWSDMKMTDWNNIQDAYDLQFSTGVYASVDIPFFNITGLKMRISINDQDIRCFGVKLYDVDVTLTEQQAL